MDKGETINYTSRRWLSLKPFNVRMEIRYRDGRKEHREFYYGSTYLSQSGRRLALGEDVTGVMVFDFNGRGRKLDL